MIKKSAQMNKMGVKKQETKDRIKKTDTKKKPVNKVYECLSCGRKQISTEAPTDCVCHNGCFAVNKMYGV